MYNAIDLGDLELTKAVDDTNAEEEKEMNTWASVKGTQFSDTHVVGPCRCGEGVPFYL